jgi:hypothetical protein
MDIGKNSTLIRDQIASAVKKLDSDQAPQLKSDAAALMQLVRHMVDQSLSPELQSLAQDDLKSLKNLMIRSKMEARSVSKDDVFWDQVAQRQNVFDPKEVVDGLKEYIANSSDKSGIRFGDEEDFYTYCVCPKSRTAYQTRVRDLDFDFDKTKTEFGDFLTFCFGLWKRNMLQRKEALLDSNPGMANLYRELESVDENDLPTSYDGLKEFYGTHHEIEKYAAPMFQDGASSNKESFIVVNTQRLYGYSHPPIETGYRIYLNSKVEHIHDVAKELLNESSRQILPIDFKFQDWPSYPGDSGRFDKLVVYSNEARLADYAAIVEDIKAKHQDWFNEDLPANVLEFKPGIGLAKSPLESGISFSGKMSKFYHEVLTRTVSILIQEQGDKEIEFQAATGKQTNNTVDNIFLALCRPIYNNLESHFEGQKDFIDNFASDLKLSGFALDLMKSKYPEIDPRLYKPELLTAKTRCIQYITPNLDRELVVEAMNRDLETIAKKHGVDIENLAFGQS